MGLVLVTGISGSGKSAACEALKGLGHHAVDSDGEGYSHWMHRHTGEVAVDPASPVPAGWLDDFAWRIDVDRVQALAAATSGVTFLCGNAENEVDVWPDADRIVCLVIDDDTLRHRLATRTTNEFGKHPEELEAAITWNQSVVHRYSELGATLVDATRPLAEVVDDVLMVATGTAA